MKLIYFLLMAVLQDPAQVPTDPVAARSEVAGDSTAVEVLPLNELRQRVAGGEFVPVPRDQLRDVLNSAEARLIPNAASTRPQIREARYSATLNGTHLESGVLQFDIYADSGKLRSGPLLIGLTNLQQLMISDGHGPIPLGADSKRRLFLLRPDAPGTLSGSWTSEGQIAGEVVTFRLELPAATTSRLELTAPASIDCTGVGCLVLPSEAVGEARQWIIVPGDASRLTFSCRIRRSLKSQDPLSLAGFSASHLLSGDILSSRWTLGLPPDLSDRVMLRAHVAGGVRISGVALDDKRPVEWQVLDENGLQVLQMMLPDAAASATLTVSAASVFAQADTWDLPMLSMTQWHSGDGLRRGPVLVPIGQISVRLPPSIELDEWVLLGIQERDVVTGPDQSREFQLTQFLPEASAVARTSVSNPRVSDSVVTIVEPAGRLATVRCLVNVTCEEAAVVELQWPVSPGWQVIAARYASNSRALFFESLPIDPAAEKLLTVHLPETLEPTASRVFEIQLQQSDTSDSRTLGFPLNESAKIRRTDSAVVFPPALSLSSDLQRRWGAGRKSLTNDEVRMRFPWYPEARLSPGIQSWDASKAAMPSTTPAPDTEPVEADVIRREHAIRFAGGQVIESSRLVLPPGQDFGAALSVLLPAASTPEPRWFLDGEPVAARREGPAEESAGWTTWMVPLARRRAGLPVVIRSEASHTPGPEFTAAIPWPQSALPSPGTLQLFSSEEGLLDVSQLVPETASTVTATASAEQFTLWQLPQESRIVRVRVEQNPRIEGGQTIDVQMLHLIGEHAGGLEQDVLAIANVSRSAGQGSLPLSLPIGIRPLVLVNGHRVQLQDTPDGLAIPLPPSSVDCQVLLTWSEPSVKPDHVTGERRLPRLFLRELSVPQCTHHVLVNPELELRAPSTAYAASEPTDVIRMLDRLLNPKGSGNPGSLGIPVRSVPAEVRRFVTRWQLSAAQGWQHRTLIDTVSSEAPISVEVTQTRRRLAIAAGAFLVLIACCIGLRQTVHQHRFAAAVAAVGLLSISFFVESSVAEALLRGAFWGLSAGLPLVMISRWQWLRATGRPAMLQVTASAAVILLSVTPCWAWQRHPTDVLVPETPVPGSDLVYVRRQLVEQWQQHQTAEELRVPQAVVTSLRACVVAEPAASIELKLILGVATVSGETNSVLRIPLQGSRLVECLLDGVKVLPEPDGDDAILVPVPASVIVRSVPLMPSRLSADGHVPDDSPATRSSHVRPLDELPETTVAAGPHAAFTVHTIECRLRPVTARLSSGVQFRLPGLPCPATTIEVADPTGTFSKARAQTPDGVVQWNPADGMIATNGLAGSDGIDVRLFQKGFDNGSDQLATVNTLTVCEAVAGRQLLTCVCRFSQWNLLVPEMHYRIPTGYELLSVSALPAVAAEPPTDLLWSVKDQTVTILLQSIVRNEFVLSLQLRSLSPSGVEEQSLPVAQLQQFDDCAASKSVLLAVRANPVFSVLPLEGDQISTAAFTDVQSAWGQWLRRSDSLFRIPVSLSPCVVRLTPRTSVNEVRVSQDVTLQNSQMNWTCRIDVETSVLPVFRHRLTISSAIEISNLQVSAGEANRLASWHRRGDQLLIQLKEGTTGLHGISIQGRQIVGPDDTSLTLPNPRLQNSRVLESSLTLTDLDGLGMAFATLDGAVPDQQIAPEEILATGVPVRLQIIREAKPVELRRIRPVEPFGSIAVIRSADQVTFVMHVTQWSGSLGPLQLGFSNAAVFVREPVVLAAGQQLILVRESNEFVADPAGARSLFDQPEFSVVWTMPIDESQQRQQSAVFEWPLLTNRIQWSGVLLVPLDEIADAGTENSGTAPLPAWLTDAAARAGAKDLSSLKAVGVSQSPASFLSENRITVPVPSAPDQTTAEADRDLFAISDTIVWSDPHQSAVGETLFLLFAARTPARCTLRIPTGTVVTELESDQPTRWEDASRENVVVELTRHVTVVKTRWLSERADSSMLSTQLTLAPPVAADCMTRRIITVASSERQRPEFSSTVDSVPDRDLAMMLVEDINAGLNHARPVAANADVMQDPSSSVQALALLVTDSHRQFIKVFEGRFTDKPMTGSCRSTDSAAVQVSIGRSLQLSTVLSLSAGFFILAIAALSRRGAAGPADTAATVLTQPDNASLAPGNGADKSSVPDFSLASSVGPSDHASENAGNAAGSHASAVNIRATSTLPETTVRAPSTNSGGSFPM